MAPFNTNLVKNYIDNYFPPTISHALDWLVDYVVSKIK